MALKKNFFKKLQNNISISPIKQNGIGVDKKTPNIVQEVNDNSLPPNNDWMTARIYKENAKKRNEVNERLEKYRLEQAMEANPNMSAEDLKSYMFSNKPGMLPEKYALGYTGGYSSFDKYSIESPMFPSNALNIEDGDQFTSLRNSSSYDIRKLNVDTNMMNMSNEEKREYLNNKITDLNTDPKNKGQVYKRDSLQNFNDWFSDDITRQRLAEQAQFAGNIRTKEEGGNVAGDLLSEGDIDGMLSSAMDSSWNFGPLNTRNAMETLQGSVNPQFGTKDKKALEAIIGEDVRAVTKARNFLYDNGKLRHGLQPKDRNALTNEEASDLDIQQPGGSYSGIGDVRDYTMGDDGEFMGGININEQTLNLRPPSSLYNAPTSNYNNSDTTMQGRSKQNTGFHELTHYTGLDKAMDPFLRSILKKEAGIQNRVTEGHGLSPRTNYNAYQPGEMYANFSEFRKSIGMKPGEQFTRESLQKRLEESKLYIKRKGLSPMQDDFIKNFSRKSIVEALNTVADADKTTPGQSKFNDLKMMESDMNTEVA